MISKIAASQPFAGAHTEQPAATPAASAAQNADDRSGQNSEQHQGKPAVKVSEPPAEPLLRLEIKHDGQGRYIYTLTDRNTGRTVVEIPREALETLGSSETYTAGTVVSTKA